MDFLRDYQIEAVEKMKNGCILNGGVGSGKSRTALYYYYTKVCGGSWDKNRHPMKKPRTLYIITTAMKRDKKEWEEELLPFGRVEFVIDSWNNIQKYNNTVGAFFIFDEDRVTGKGKWVKSFLKIAKKNKWIILSATPGDTWEQYIPVFVANGFYKNRSEFLEEHAVWAHYCKFPKIDKYINVGRLIHYRNDILIPMKDVRITRRHDEDVMCDYDMAKYKEVMRSRWDIYKDEPIQQASGLCYVLRHIVNEDESRQVKLLELLEDHERAIIFYNFDYELDILKNLGYARGTRIAEWNGHLHEEIPKTKRWVYLVQYTAGCEGWNCVLTDTIIFYSQTYSYKVLEQSRGRIDRMNTKFVDLYYYHFISKSKIDLAIGMALDGKRKFNENKFVEKLWRK